LESSSEEESKSEKNDSYETISEATIKTEEKAPVE
jgi:hypothetical protein